MTSITRREDGIFGQPLERIDPTPMELLAAAVEKGIDPDKLGVLVDLKERLDRQAAARDYAEALAAFQAKCPRIQKRREAAFGGRTAYRFASLDDIMVVIQPILRDCGLSVSFATKMADGMIEATCIIRHGIHSESHPVTMPVPADMKVNATQQAGAALSYAKRYAICAALNIVVTDEDDDAGGMAETITEEQAITIGEMLQALDETPDRMLAWLGVPRIGDIPAARYVEVLGKLKGKLAQKGR